MLRRSSVSALLLTAVASVWRKELLAQVLVDGISAESLRPRTWAVQTKPLSLYSNYNRTWTQSSSKPVFELLKVVPSCSDTLPEGTQYLLSNMRSSTSKLPIALNCMNPEMLLLHYFSVGFPQIAVIACRRVLWNDLRFYEPYKVISIGGCFQLLSSGPPMQYQRTALYQYEAPVCLARWTTASLRVLNTSRVLTPHRLCQVG